MEQPGCSVLVRCCVLHVWLSVFITKQFREWECNAFIRSTGKFAVVVFALMAFTIHRKRINGQAIRHASLYTLFLVEAFIVAVFVLLYIM